MTVNHEASLVAVHAHPAVVVTVIGEPALPVAAIEALPSAIEYVHGGGGAAELGDSEGAPGNRQVAGPLRAGVGGGWCSARFRFRYRSRRAVTVNHGASLVAVHAHPAVVVTVIGEPAPPVAAIEALPGAIEYVHGGGGAAGRLGDSEGAAGNRQVAGPLRAGVGGGRYDTLPLPLPVAPAVTVNHGASLVAVHAHPAVVVTVIGEPAPPVAASVALVGAIAYAQGVGAA